MEVPPPDDDTLLRFMKRRYKAEPEEEQALRQILRAVGNHTQMAEIIAKTLKAACGAITAGDILWELSALESHAETYPKVAGRYHGFLAENRLMDFYRRLFSVSQLPGVGRRVLAYLSVIPPEGCREGQFSRFLSGGGESRR